MKEETPKEASYLEKNKKSPAELSQEIMYPEREDKIKERR